MPAVFERPMKTPAWRGAMSMWFTLNPPRAIPAIPNVMLVASTPPAAFPARGISSSAPAVPQNPARRKGVYKGVNKEQNISGDVT